MCLIAFRFAPEESIWLELAANRDEFHERLALPMHWWAWPDGPLAGRDQAAGGTWLAVSRDGRWAAVTNFRDPGAASGERSRGELPVDFLAARSSPAEYAIAVNERRNEYGPFNLLVGNREALWYASSHADASEVLPGVHALSNGVLDAPWPKSRRATAAFERDGAFEVERGFELMNDRRGASSEELPDTGVGEELERFLSPPFIVGDRYGTRCTSLVSLGDECRAAERRFDRTGAVIGELRYAFEPD